MVIDSPALVIGAGLNGLGVARSLGSSGVSVYMADTDARRAEMHTRHAKPLVISSLQGEVLLRELERLAETRFAGQRPVLFLTQEQTVRTLANAQDALRASYRFLLPPANLLLTLMNKEGFDRLAEQTGLRVPRTIHVRQASDVTAALELSFPLVIKPALHAAEYERRFRKAYRVDEVGEAKKLLDQILEVLPDVIVQEWIPGNDSDIYFCLQNLAADGRVDASFSGRKIRSWPPNVGGTASCISATECAELADMTEAFFRAVGMCGLASMEYKRHAVTEEFVAIEPTVGRTDYQEEVATLNGVNLPLAYYLAASDAMPAVDRRQSAMQHSIWRDRQADTRSAAHPEQGIRGWPSGHGRVFDAMWRIDDPAPWLWSQWLRILTRLDKLTGRLHGNG